MRTLLVTGWGGREGEDRNEEEVEEDVVDRGGIDQGGDQGGEDVVGGRELREGEVRGLSLAQPAHSRPIGPRRHRDAQCPQRPLTE